MFATALLADSTVTYDSLLAAIDKKMVQVAKNYHSNISYGMDNYVDYELFYNLEDYKNILLEIRSCTDCFCKEDYKVMEYNINKLINTNC